MPIRARLTILAFTISAVAILATMTTSAQDKPTDKLSYFVYADKIPDLKATIYLPEALGEWGVQNPYKTADQSLIKSPQVFVKAAFQNIATPALYGVLRVVYDLKGTDCYTVFTGLAQLDGLRLQTYSSSTSSQIKNGKGYVFDFRQDQRKLIVGSKVVCDDKYGLELMVVSPDEQQYASAAETILKASELTIPGTPIQGGPPPGQPNPHP